MSTVQPASSGSGREDEEGCSLLRGHPRYTPVRELGSGAYSRVVLALDRLTGQYLALKLVRRGPQSITKYVEREIVNQLKLRHPSIIALHEVFLTDAHLVLVMEYAAGGSLFQFVSARRGLTEQEARWFFQQLIIALDFCHRMGVSNRDIKLENTLLDGGEWPAIKLADFGFSKDRGAQSAPTSRVGTPAYLAPEVVLTRPGQPYDGAKADVWSCGVLLYTMVANQYPFRRREDGALQHAAALKNMLQRILRVDYAFPPDRPFSYPLMDLISRMLVQDPQQRYSVQHVMAHPWFLQDLHPDALRCNEALVAESLAHLPSPQMLQEVRAIVQEACPQPAAAAAPATSLASTVEAAMETAASLSGQQGPGPLHGRLGGL